jgi:methylated-DNA-protein-cysteine methyltransferase-like protein
MRSAPKNLNLPCHRVVNKSGAMAPDYIFGGAANQRSKLALEGITFKEDGCIDLAKNLWQVYILP